MSTCVKKVVQKAFSPRYLFFTNTALGTTFYTAADLLEQKINNYVHNNAGINLERSKAMATGGLVFGAVCHHWYAFLDRKFPGTSKAIMTRKLASEAAAGPPFALLVFMVVGKLEGKSPERCWSDFKENFVFLCLADWGFYVPLQFLNFYYLPPKYRFLYVAGITLVYDTVLAYLLHRPSPSMTKSSNTMEHPISEMGEQH